MNKTFNDTRTSEARRTRFEQQGGRRMSPATAILVAVLALGAAFVYVAFSGRGATTAGTSAAGTGSVTIPVAQFDDGAARFYTHTTASGRQVRFFVMKSSDGVIRAAFDACDTCFQERRGYRQEGDVMVCNNCNRSFPSTDINVLKGGCNPSPLDRSIVGGQVVLTSAALEAGVVYF